MSILAPFTKVYLTFFTTTSQKGQIMHKSYFSYIILLFVGFFILSACTQSGAPQGDEVREAPAVFFPEYEEPVAVNYEAKEGLAIYQDDIKLGYVDSDGNLISEERGVGVGGDALWPGGVVPYVIEDALGNQPSKDEPGKTMRQLVDGAIKELNDKTVLTFKPKTTEDLFITFASSSQCASWIGRKTNKPEGAKSQTIDIANQKGYCGRTSIMHEILHAVGIKHEQARSDRDQHITINWTNITEKNRHNYCSIAETYNKTTKRCEPRQTPNGKNLGPYNYASIMHYSCYGFSVNGQPTITPKDPNVGCRKSDGKASYLGQRETLSPGDIAAVNALYAAAPPAPNPTPTTPTLPFKSGNVITLKANDGNLLARDAEFNDVIAAFSPTAVAASRFTVTVLNGNKITLKADNGRYVSHDGFGGVAATGNAGDAGSQFTVNVINGKITLKANNDKFLRLDTQFGDIIADSNAESAAAQFTPAVIQ